MWDAPLHRAALLELVVERRLKRRRGQAEAWDDLATMSWTRRTSRQDELELADLRRAEVEEVLGRVWPGWRSVAATLDAEGLPPSPRGLAILEDRQRQAATPGPFPTQRNQHTAAASVGPHSKAVLTPQRRQALGEVDLTRDGIVRLRPHRGLALRRDGVIHDPAVWISVLGELALPERALKAGLELVGSRPELVLLIENLGTYIDIEAPPEWLVAHVPGWDTATATLLLRQCDDLPVVLFGDLDPAGVKIAAHMRQLRPELRWATFGLWRTLLPYALVEDWPDGLDLTGAPPLVQELADKGLWLEQERLVLDRKLIPELRVVASLPPVTPICACGAMPTPDLGHG